jgi:hypothetical protein
MESSELSVVTRQRDLSSSGVSWGAVIAGAFVAAALSLIMLALGAGFGLSAVSPWSNVGIAASMVGAVAIIWLVVIQVTTSALGGYLAGRLRSRWLTIHGDEVHFRDTAHGLVTWAVGVVITVSLLATAATTMAGESANTGADSKSLPAYFQDPNAYFVDLLFRSDRPGTGDADLPPRAEASRIFARDLRDASAPDGHYLAKLIVAKTGLSQSEAEQRVSRTIEDAKQTEDKVRQATAHLLLWIFIALLAGAFCASYAATIGGRQRDHVRHIESNKELP